MDSVWLNGNSAIFGSGGAGGAITVGSGVTVGNLTINTNYTFSANTLTLVNTPTITVVGPATTTTIGSLLAGTGFTKAGPGTLLLNQAANNTYTGDTIINNGMVQPGSTGGRLYPRLDGRGRGSLVAVVQVDVPTALTERAKTLLAELEVELRRTAGGTPEPGKARAAGTK